jgi:hypothetical protein
MPVPSLLAYLLVLLVSARPSGHIHDRACWEAPGEYEARVARHIDTAAAWVYSSDPVVEGPWGHEQTLVQLLAISHHESAGYCHAVDEGRLTGDHGNSVCACGIMLHNGRAEGYTRAQLIGDLGPCYSAGLTRLALSWPRCTAYQFGRLHTYASGQCGLGNKEARDMINRSNWWWGLVLRAWKEGKIR